MAITVKLVRVTEAIILTHVALVTEVLTYFFPVVLTTVSDVVAQVHLVDSDTDRYHRYCPLRCVK